MEDPFLDGDLNFARLFEPPTLLYVSPLHLMVNDIFIFVHGDIYGSTTSFFNPISHSNSYSTSSYPLICAARVAGNLNLNFNMVRLLASFSLHSYYS
jgi:hypothetical protein